MGSAEMGSYQGNGVGLFQSGAKGFLGQETIAKMRETPNQPLRHGTHSHSQMPGEELLQQTPAGFAKCRLTCGETAPSGHPPHPSRTGSTGHRLTLPP